MSTELELLDTCAHGGDADGAEKILNVENWLFDGDRARLLHVVERMLCDGLIEVLRGGVAVPPWELSAWARAPLSPETGAALDGVTLRTTDAGLRWF